MEEKIRLECKESDRSARYKLPLELQSTHNSIRRRALDFKGVFQVKVVSENVCTEKRKQ
jgi:hypothetical protein